MNVSEDNVKLSMQRAMLGEISCNIRMVSYVLGDKGITIYAMIDGEIEEDDEESMECVSTEVNADFFPEFVATVKLIRIDSPQPIDKFKFGTIVYHRKEVRHLRTYP